MKKLATVFLSTSLFAVAGSSAIYAAPVKVASVKEVKDYDFEKINQSLKMATDQYLVNHNNVVELGYKFDPAKTDVAKDKYRIDLNLTLAKAPWTEEMVKTMAGIDFKAVEKNKEDKFTVSLQATIETKTLDMLKYHAGRVTNKCKLADETQGLIRVLAKRDCQFAQEIASFSSIDSLHDGIVRHRKDHLNDLKSYQIGLKEASNAANTESVRELLDGQRQQAYSFETFLQNAKIEQQKDGSFIVTAGELKIPGMKTLHGVKLIVSETKIQFEIVVSTNYGRSIYLAGKPILESVLDGLEQQDESAIKLVKLDTEFWLNLLTLHHDETGNENLLSGLL